MIKRKITRFNDDDIIIYENEKIYGIRERIKIKSDNSDKEYEVKQGETLRDIASYKEVYDDARLYWIIAEYNNIIDPFEKLTEGKIIKYPTFKRVMEEIF